MIAEALAALAVAVAPAGFREAPKLEPAASWAAGKPVQVYCGITKLGDTYENGYAPIGGNAVFLTETNVCAPLESAASGRRPFSETMGTALLVLVHEAKHASGISDESQTDCAALRQIAAVGIQFFRLRGQRAYLRNMTAAAWANHSRSPEQYRRTC